MNQPRFTTCRLRFRAPVCPHAMALLGALCALACSNRYEIGDIVAKQTPQQRDGSSNAFSTTAMSTVSPVPRTILTDAYDVDATVAEPEAPDWEPTILPLGDVDGDGYRDWAECGFKPIEGRVTRQIVYGAPRLPRGGVVVPDRASLDFPGGGTVAPAGDVNGDGYADLFINQEVIVIATNLDHPYPDADGTRWVPADPLTTLASQGTSWDAPLAFLVLGGPERATGPQPLPSGALAFGDRDGLATHFTSELASATRNTVSEAAQQINLHSIGDLDHDGFDDFSVTTTFGFDEEAQSSDGTLTFAQLENRTETVSYVVYGSSSLESSRAAAVRLAGIRAVYPVGDVDGDGFGDLLLIDADRAYLWRGGAERPSGALNPEVDAVLLDGFTPAPATYMSVDSYGKIVDSTGSVGDLDHDGYGDFIVDGGSTDDAASLHKAFLFYGSSKIFSGPLAASSANAVFDLEPNATVQHAGDWNGDGYDDLIIDHQDLNTVRPFPGGTAGFLFPALTETRLLPGGPQRWTGTITVPEDQLALITNSENPRNAVYQVTPAGDLDGDGFADLLLFRGFPGSNPSDPYVYADDTAIKYGGPLPALSTQIH